MPACPVEGQEPHSLPLLVCPICGKGGGVPSVQYPWIDLKQLLQNHLEKRLRWGKTRLRGTDPQGFTWKEFEDVKCQIRKVLPLEYPLPPSAMFGRYKGKLYSKPKPADFLMPDPFTLLVRRNVASQIEALGHKLHVFDVELKFPPRRLQEPYVQIWAPPVGRSATGSGNKFCQCCEKGAGRERFVVERPNTAANESVFVLRDALSPIIFSEEIVAAIEANRFSGLCFEITPSD